MNYKLLYSILFLYNTLTISLSAQVSTPIQNTEITVEGKQPMLLGHCSIDAFLRVPYNSWFTTNYKNYLVDSLAITELRPLLKKKRIDLFMGTWCGDSKREVPIMIKILEAAGFDTSLLSIVCVSNQTDQYKKCPQGEEIGKNILRIPTLIVYHKRKEMGRIIESPIVSIERDLIRILKQDGYIPNYANLKSD